MTNCGEAVTLKFYDENETMLVDTALGPFPTSTSVALFIKVDVPTSLISEKTVEKSCSARILAASVTNGITFTLSASPVAHAEVQIYSADGKKIRELPFNSHGAGTYTIFWDGKNEHNRSVPPGGYTVRILTGRESLCTAILHL